MAARALATTLGGEKAKAEYEAQRLNLRVRSLHYALNLAFLNAKKLQDKLAELQAREDFGKRDDVALAAGPALATGDVEP